MESHDDRTVGAITTGSQKMEFWGFFWSRFQSSSFAATRPRMGFSLKRPGSVMDVNLVKVKEEKEEEFEMLQDLVIVGSRSSKNVILNMKFDVELDIIEPGNTINKQ